MKRKAPQLILKSLNALDAGMAAIESTKKVERKRYAHYSKNGAGEVKRVDSPPKDWAHKTKSEGKPSLVIKPKRQLKLKTEYWDQRTLTRVFFGNEINMGASGNQWNVYFDSPARKMTGQDQLDIFLMSQDTMFEVRHNLDKKHIVISDKAGTVV